MSFLSRLSSISSAILQYGGLASHAVQQVEAEVGPGNGATKKQLAISYVLAAAHAGEAVPMPQVQAIASAVELAAGIANAIGLFGAPKAATVSVPAAEPAAAK
jgi:hypothetical protein